ncbi:putative FAD dependent oxidoreductase [Colletotrichum chrysophilum]|uniref:FAD dependent oxidoreductase n=1 Tax=Colletotrichum chrysophilum TaxID=1836956 RepID=A0AAD9AK97_9PEZI|nr:putative FAD dependent oxidoreductase [Colletotrichum chrysophilum]
MLDSVGVHNWEIIEASDRVGGRFRTVFVDDTEEFAEMGPMRLPYHQVTYKSDDSTHAYSDLRMTFQLADLLDRMNESDEKYRIDFIPWIQHHPNELLAFGTGRHSDGRVPTPAEIAKDPSLDENVTDAIWTSTDYDVIWDEMVHNSNLALDGSDDTLGETEWKCVDKGFNRMSDAFIPHVSDRLILNRKIRKLEPVHDEAGNSRTRLSWYPGAANRTLESKDYDYTSMAVTFTVTRLGRRRSVISPGIFGLSLAVALSKKLHVFDRHQYDESGYSPDFAHSTQAASVDHNKIFRASYGKSIHYQRLALESRSAWEKINELRREEKNEEERSDLFSGCGMLRVQPDADLGALERETLRNFERDGLRDTQFVKSDPTDRQRATERGWDSKLLEFAIPDSSSNQSFEAVLDSTAGFTKCSEACAYFYKIAERQGVVFHFGPQKGGFGSLIEENVPESSKKRAIGLKTKDGVVHKADVVVIAAGSFSTQLLPELSYHLESSAGSVVIFKVDKDDERLWDKYSPERFPVITWKSAARTVDGKDIGSIYVFPRTSDGLIKIGYRGVKFTNFQPAPPDAGFTQDGKWSVPMSPADSRVVPDRAREAIKPFVSIFLPDFKEQDFYSTKMCWYTDSLDNSFVIDYVPNYADNSVFVCTGGSGHGAKFLPVLGEHAADILLNGEQSNSFMRPYWRWRETARRGNGLEEGPKGPRNIGSSNQ